MDQTRKGKATTALFFGCGIETNQEKDKSPEHQLSQGLPDETDLPKKPRTTDTNESEGSAKQAIYQSSQSTIASNKEDQEELQRTSIS